MTKSMKSYLLSKLMLFSFLTEESLIAMLPCILRSAYCDLCSFLFNIIKHYFQRQNQPRLEGLKRCCSSRRDIHS